MMAISVIGLGKLGVCTAACFAVKGFKVIGVDINKNIVEAINSGRAPVHETRLSEFVEASKGYLVATEDYEYALLNSDITFLIVPTPSKEDGNFSDQYLRDALKSLSQALHKKTGYHIFVITSTVSPGTIGQNLIPLIESISGKKLNQDFGVAYNPEFIALGSVIHDFLNPDLVLIGESDKRVGDKIEELYRLVCDNSPRIARMSIISAEITKISLNSFITMKISFANTLANICEKIPEANIDDITTAIGADRRISPYYLKGGLSYGGPCFPRDNKAFTAFAQKYGVDAKLAKSTDEINQIQLTNLTEKVIECVKADNSDVVAVLGLAYKPNTPVIEESPAIKLIESLLRMGVSVIVYDPLAMDNAKVYFGDKITYATSIRECFSHAHVCVITTETDEFRNIDETYIVHSPTTIIDCWRILGRLKFIDGVKYIAVGKKEIQI